MEEEEKRRMYECGNLIRLNSWVDEGRVVNWERVDVDRSVDDGRK